MVKFSEATDNPGCKVLDRLELEEIIFKNSETVFLLSKLMCYSLWKALLCIMDCTGKTNIYVPTNVEATLD